MKDCLVVRRFKFVCELFLVFAEVMSGKPLHAFMSLTVFVRNACLCGYVVQRLGLWEGPPLMEREVPEDPSDSARLNSVVSLGRAIWAHWESGLPGRAVAASTGRVEQGCSEPAGAVCSLVVSATSERTNPVPTCEDLSQNQAHSSAALFACRRHEDSRDAVVARGHVEDHASDRSSESPVVSGQGCVFSAGRGRG